MTKNRIPIEPYQKLDLESLGLTSELTSKAVYFVSGNTRFVAAAAMAQALIESKTIWALAGWFLKLPVIRSIAKPVYFLVAANRHRLPGGTPECQLPQS
jgi:predicted DCC family thiol-disulfide oxidoreductase YuxK